jgi:hypothetical protein
MIAGQSGAVARQAVHRETPLPAEAEDKKLRIIGKHPFEQKEEEEEDNNTRRSERRTDVLRGLTTFQR